MFIEILKYIILFLLIYVVDMISSIFMAIKFSKECKGDCKECKMWSCTNQTDYDGGANIFPYDNFKNVCGKEKFNFK